MNNYINFKDYNDYELIYLIKEGNEAALNFFFEKYDKYIKKVVYSIVYSDICKREDYIQEGRMILYESIFKYDDQLGISFFAYFSFVLKRKYIKLLRYDIRTKYVLCEDVIIDTLPRKTNNKIKGKTFFSDKLKIEIFDNCIINNVSLKDFARIKKISYHKIYYIYQKMIEELKEYF